MSNSGKLIQGFGVNDLKGATIHNGERDKAYMLWKAVINRCYNTKALDRKMSYLVVSISDDFKYFSDFKTWVEKQKGFNAGWQLDKDLLSKDTGNLMYSKNTCVFLPNEVNNAIKRRTYSMLKGTPEGVCLCQTKREYYRSQVSIGGKKVGLGTYPTMEMAHQAYKEAKEGYIKSLAEKWKEGLDDRAYEALRNYNLVSID